MAVKPPFLPLGQHTPEITGTGRRLGLSAEVAKTGVGRAGVGDRSKKARRSRSQGGPVEEGPEGYWLIRYVRSPLSDLKDSTVNPAFFIAPAMKPRTVCFCQPILSMISASVAPFFRWSIATTWAVLLPSRGAVASRAFAAVLLLGAFFGAVIFLAALPLAVRAPLLALRSAFGFSG